MQPPALRWDSSSRRRLRQLAALRANFDRELNRLEAPEDVRRAVTDAIAHWRAAAVASLTGQDKPTGA
jgi:MoxR-like ATPase